MRREYTRKEVAARIGISDRTVWFYTEKGLVVPEIDNPHGRGTTRKYSTKNILEILVIREFAKHGLDLETIKHIMTAPRLRGSDGFDPWDPESAVESDRRYYLVMLDPNTDHGRLIATHSETDGVFIPMSSETSGLGALPGRDYSCALVIDLANLRKRVRG